MKNSKIDDGTIQACKIAKTEYCDVARESHNEIQGLMIGTAVKVIEGPNSRPSKYYGGGRAYWFVKVECPNGEIKTLGCDALEPRKTDKPFLAQQRTFNYRFGKKKK